VKFDIKDFEMLEAIHENGTFAKAAEYLHKTPSAITQNINKLEHLLGFALFDRTGYRPILTSQGRLFLERGKQVLLQVNRLEQDLTLIDKGWESEFSIAYDDLISIESLFPILAEFQKTAPHVNLRIYREVLNGCWDALFQNKVTLAIGASGEPPRGLLSDQKTIGDVQFSFVIAPHHPLNEYSEPLSNEAIQEYPCIVISDTSSYLPVRTSGISQGQSIIVVPNMDAKIRAQIHGLGVGYLPEHRIQPYLDNGQLIKKSVFQQKTRTYLKAAWRTDSNSKILKWFLEKLDETSFQKKLFLNSFPNLYDKKY